jgi:dihydrofolate reductase
MTAPELELVAAVAANGVIGRGGQLPWHLPDDLKHFRAKTLGKPVIMGRRTFESIGKPLPGRRNVIVTRDPAFRAEGCFVAHDLDAALDAAGPAPEIVVIGGASLYLDFLPRAERIYLTEVHAEVDGDSFFPDLSPVDWSRGQPRAPPPTDAPRDAFSFVELWRFACPTPRGQATRPAPPALTRSPANEPSQRSLPTCTATVAAPIGAPACVNSTCFASVSGSSATIWNSKPHAPWWISLQASISRMPAVCEATSSRPSAPQVMLSGRFTSTDASLSPVSRSIFHTSLPRYTFR